MRLQVQELDISNIGTPHRHREDRFLDKKQVHVWFAALGMDAQGLERLENVLAPEERSRSRRFHFERDRRRFVARRAILRWLIGRYTGLDSTAIRFESGPAGKPHLAGQGQDEPLTFSVSHSKGAVLFGFARGRRIGVDLERLQPMMDMERIVTGFFSDREKDAFFSLSPERRREAFFRCWTGKEAFLKALGDGLSRRLDQFDLLPEPDGRLNLQWVGWDPDAPARWSLQNLTTLAGFTAAVAFELDLPI